MVRKGAYPGSTRRWRRLRQSPAPATPRLTCAELNAPIHANIPTTTQRSGRPHSDHSSGVLVDRLAADHRAKHLSTHASTFEGGVARARLQFLLPDDPRHLEVDDNQIGWRAGRERPGVEAEKLCGFGAHRLDQPGERHVAGMDEAKPRGEQCLEPYGAVR